MARIREHFTCPVCSTQWRADHQNTILGGDYNPNALTCTACNEGTMRHCGLDIETGTEQLVPPLSTAGQAMLDSVRIAATEVIEG